MKCHEYYDHTLQAPFLHGPATIVQGYAYNPPQ